MIQKVYLLHDHIYSDLSLIPQESLDGKDYPKVRYIIADEIVVEDSAEGYILYDTFEQAKEEIE